MDRTEQLTQALKFFKDWSNYLLVATVAALGWTAEKSGITGLQLKFYCVAALGVSVVFGILTLALIPLVQEQREDQNISNYEVPVHFWFWPEAWPGVRLTWICTPQHVFFIIGIAIYVYAAWP
jgi:hypothetical protein